MAHTQQLTYISSIKEKFKNNFKNSTVLEIGSLNINGSIRQFFDNCNYIGIDVGPGKDVDIVCEGQSYDAPSNSVDTVISCECFEHNPYWAETFFNMIRICRSDGIVIFTCATTGRKEHGTTRTSPADSPLTVGKGWDYYKNLVKEDFEGIADLNSLFSSFEFSSNSSSKDLYFWGIKK
jgi:SAM-dependent methyltransferase